MAPHISVVRLIQGGAFAIVLAGAAAVCQAPATAQSSVAIGAPLVGEVVLNRDVEVRAAPSEAGRLLSTQPKGKALTALGTPRGTNWTQVAIGGVPLGYVPADALDQVYVPEAAPDRPLPRGGAAASVSPSGAAAVPRAAREAVDGLGAQGYLVATRNLSVTERLPDGKRRSVALRKGQVVGLTAIRGSRLDLALPGRAPLEAQAEGFTGVAAAYTDGTPAGSRLFVGRLGEFLSYEEGLQAWQRFIAGPGIHLADRAPMVWPVIRSGRVQFLAGIGPFTAADLDRACASLTRQGYDCRPIPLTLY